MDNIKAALAAFSVNAVSRISGYILVTFNEHQADDAARVIRTVPGVARVSLAYHTNRDPQEYCAAAVKALTSHGVSVADCSLCSTPEMFMTCLLYTSPSPRDA